MTPRELAAAVHEERRMVWMKWMVAQGYVSDWPLIAAHERRKRERLRLLLLRAPVRAEVGR